MNKPLSARQNRSLALGLLMFALVVAIAAVAVPVYLLHRHYDQRLEDLDDRLEGYQRVAASRDTLKQRLAMLSALDGGRYYLKSAGPALAAGEIQERVKTLIEAFGGRLASMQILPHKDEDGYRRVAVNAQVMGSLATIQDILRMLESGEPFLFVDNLSMRTLRSSGGTGPGTPEDDLMVQFDVIGYAIPRGGR